MTRQLILLYAFGATLLVGEDIERLQCLPTQTRVYFGNGIRTSQADAVADAFQLDRAIRSTLPSNVAKTSFQVCLAYDSLDFSPGSGLSALNPFAQLLDAAEQEGVADVPQFLAWAVDLDDAPTWLQNAALSIIKDAQNQNLAIRPDLQLQITQYEADLTVDRKVVVVAHSQGNLYANEAYNEILPDDSLFKIIAVATPASYVAGQGPYTTLHNDIIHRISPGALPPNLNNDPPCSPLHEFRCHDFTRSYLAGNSSGPRILSEIIQELPTTSSPRPTPPSAAFLMTSGNQSATSGHTLNISVSGGASAPVTFSDQSQSNHPSASIAYWLWYVNGTLVSTASTFSQAFSPGIYQLSLFVGDNTGTFGQAATALLVVNTAAAKPPLASFTLTQGDQIASEGQTLLLSLGSGQLVDVGFNGSASRSGYAIVKWDWTIDGTPYYT